MIFNEYDSDLINLPHTNKKTIVIITGNCLRHKWFVYRIYEEFKDFLIGWYELDTNKTIRYNSYGKPVKEDSMQSILQFLHHYYFKCKEKLLLFHEELHTNRLITLLFKCFLYSMKDISKKIKFKIYEKEQKKIEATWFGKGVNNLKIPSNLKYKRVNPQYINTDEFQSEIRELNPYFLLAFECPHLGKEILESTAGLPIRLHCGHLPQFSGSHCIEWALYHRSLNHVSATVNIIEGKQYNGPIIRCSNPCIFPDDDIAKIFARVVVLGVNLIIETIKDIQNNEKLRVYPQKTDKGRKYLKREFIDILPYLINDFKSGWLRFELNRLRNF